MYIVFDNSDEKKSKHQLWDCLFTWSYGKLHLAHIRIHNLLHFAIEFGDCLSDKKCSTVFWREIEQFSLFIQLMFPFVDVPDETS